MLQHFCTLLLLCCSLRLLSLLLRLDIIFLILNVICFSIYHTHIQCDPGVGVDRFFHALYTQHLTRMLMLLGSACSEVTESLAKVVPYWNIVQVSIFNVAFTQPDRDAVFRCSPTVNEGCKFILLLLSLHCINSYTQTNYTHKTSHTNNVHLHWGTKIALDILLLPQHFRGLWDSYMFHKLLCMMHAFPANVFIRIKFYFCSIKLCVCPHLLF